ncbi:MULTISPECIES: hypothetical protein [Parachlamydia]|jgi:ABC-type proline/glycine betaine transport system ATPase subunit|uniref:hypothetical protein n=1 Tax=Parachlamydia TaxID=83551 RepID=UPI0001C17C10|nr:hypothetical protein [Parachlamydia acanthamoebae]EFB42769.1 hypothetical protein pah_c003o061 [Parachlamydia acanthamoebae str. Hall's coccus]
MTLVLERFEALDPIVKCNLQQHFLNLRRQAKAPDALIIGTAEQLGVANKISSSDKVAECFSKDGTPRCYPNLPAGSHLVAFVERLLKVQVEVQVFVVYTLEQMIQMQKHANSGFVNRVYWRILEISKEVESDVLKKT